MALVNLNYDDYFNALKRILAFLVGDLEATNLAFQNGKKAKLKKEKGGNNPALPAIACGTNRYTAKTL